jgi:4-amino-4-deoxy-L-arabinose transferase-like glycosyltransferase
VAIQPYQSFSAYYHRMAVIILAAGFIFRVAIATWLYPGYDEAYYYLYTLHPDWSYFDHPPIVALTTGLGVWLTGQVNQFTIRLGSLLLYTGASLFIYLATLRLYNLNTAINVLAIVSVVPIFNLVFGTLNIPDTPLIFFWALTLWLAVEEFFVYRIYIPSERLIWICGAIGLACISKYHGFILGLGLVIFCLLNRERRKVFISKYFWLGVLLFLLILSPAIAWNHAHEWISFRYQSQRAVPSAGYRIDNVFLTWLVHMLYLFPVFGLPLFWFVGKASWSQIRDFKWLRGDWESTKRLFILCLSVPLIFGFTIISGYQQILPAWPMAGYWSASILLGERVNHVQRFMRSNLIYRWFFGAIVVILLLSSIAISHIHSGTFQTPNKSAIFGLLNLKDDSSVELFDTSQLRRAFTEDPRWSKALKNSDFVFTNRYYLGGQINLALDPIARKPFTCFDEDLRGFAFWSKPQDWVGKNALYISNQKNDGDKEATSRYAPYFRKFIKLGDVAIVRGGEPSLVFNIYEGQQLLRAYPRPYGND